VRTPLLILLAAVIAVSLMFALGARAVVSRTACTAHPLTVSVAAAPDIAPSISRVGRLFNSQHREVDGRCAKVAVTASAPGTVAASLDGLPLPGIPVSQARAAGSGGPRLRPPDAWIPDSSMWLDVARSTIAGARLVQPTGITVATTPLVIAMSRPSATQVPAYGTTVGWNFLLPQSAGGPSAGLGLHVRLPDPAASGTGLATLLDVRQLLGQGQQARAGLAAFTFNAQVLTTATSGSILRSLAATSPPPAGSGAPPKSEPVTVTTEQAVDLFDRAHPQQPLAARYPAGGTSRLDFPFALTATSKPLLAAAEQFGKLLRSSYATSYLRYQGFRTPSGAAPGWPAAYGLDPHRPALLSAPAAGQAATVLQAWDRLGLGARDLAVLDVSGAMATPVAPGGPTLEAELVKAAGLGLARFPDSTQMGLWAFASHLNGSLPYRQLVTTGPLPGDFGLITRRQQITNLTRKVTPSPAPAALYGTILAAYRQLVSTYQPRYVNAVIVMTAGVETPQGDISARTLIRELRQVQDPRRPVEIFVIVLGKPANLRALQQIVAVTGGQASVITSPEQIGKVFFNAISRRLCPQGKCPG
jgi:hypothetical protein